MRTAYRVLSTAFAVGAIFPIGIPTAHADTSDVKVEYANWFWAEQTFGSGPNGVPYPALPTDTKAVGVPKGDLAVAYAGQKEKKADGSEVSKPDKETYLQWDVYFIPEGSYVDSFTFTIFLDPDAEQVFAPLVAVPGQPPKGGQPTIVACLPSKGFGPGEGDAFQVKPDDDCSNQLVGAFDEATQSYAFDASTYAQDWVDGLDNFGLAIRPLEDVSDPFQLVFKGAADVKASITYTPAEPEVVTPVAPIDPVALPPLPPTDTSVYVPDAGPVPQPQPQAPPAPVVLQTRAAAPIQHVAATPLSASRALSPAFWFAMVGGVLLLGVTSLILGDPLEAAAGSRNRVRSTGRHRLNVPATVPVRATRVRPRTV